MPGVVKNALDWLVGSGDDLREGVKFAVANTPCALVHEREPVSIPEGTTNEARGPRASHASGPGTGEPCSPVHRPNATFQGFSLLVLVSTTTGHWALDWALASSGLLRVGGGRRCTDEGARSWETQQIRRVDTMIWTAR
jgi:hypothetical protein